MLTFINNDNNVSVFINLFNNNVATLLKINKFIINIIFN